MTESKILKEASDEAIKRGNKFEGFVGLSPDEFSKDELIMICNVLYDTIQQLRHDVKEAHKRLN